MKVGNIGVACEDAAPAAQLAAVRHQLVKYPKLGLGFRVELLDGQWVVFLVWAERY